MSRLSDLIAKLPEEIRPSAEQFVTLFENATTAELNDWINLISEGNWQIAYQFAIRKMTIAELITEQIRVNEILAGLNAENAQLLDAQRQMVSDLLTAGLSILVAAIKE